MKDVVIISNYWHFLHEKASSRYNTIAFEMANGGFDVEVITSKFYHTTKSMRGEFDKKEYPFKITLLEEGAYKKNVSLKRVTGHRKFAGEVLKYLKTRKKPDVIYLFVPPVGLAKKVVEYAKSNGIKVVVDILDLWPEAFEMVLPAIAVKVLLSSMKKNADYVYKNADTIISVSETYVDRALSCGGGQTGKSVYIGTDLKIFDSCAQGSQPLEGKLREITVAYIGMLGKSYDLKGAMKAMSLLREKGFDKVELLIMGDGPTRSDLEDFARENNLPVRFTGRLSYESMVKMLAQCDIAINILNKDSAASIINKHADYVASGLPVINMQTNQEFGDLLESYGAGINCAPGDYSALADSIKLLASDEEKRKQMGANSRHLAEEKFDRNVTYSQIVKIVREL